jgi:hypothetical protein
MADCSGILSGDRSLEGNGGESIVAESAIRKLHHVDSIVPENDLRATLRKRKIDDSVVGAVEYPEAILAWFHLQIRQQFSVNENGVPEELWNPGRFRPFRETG